MDTHQRPVGELTEQEACERTGGGGKHVRVLYLSMLAECLKKENIRYAAVCVFVHISKLCACEGALISVSVQSAASSALMAALRG